MKLALYSLMSLLFLGISLSQTCFPNPCLNNGVCSNSTINNSNLAYNCSCQINYFGANCEYYNACLSNPCLRGTCEQTTKAYKCVCPIGYTGEKCDKILDACTSNPCLNGGTCSVWWTVGKGSSFLCQCPAAYTEYNCQYLNACRNNPCKNNSTCQTYEDDYTCVCPMNYFDYNCQTYIPFECIYSECLQLHSILQNNFNKLSTEQLIAVLDQVNSIINSTAYQKASVNFIGLISNVLHKIANRNSNAESEALVTNFMQLIDKMLNQSLNDIMQAQRVFQSSTKFTSSLENILYKMNLISNKHEFKFDNFIAKVCVLKNASANILDYTNIMPTLISNYSSIESFIKTEKPGYALFYKQDLVNNLIQKEANTKLSFISYLNTNFFTTNDVEMKSNTSCVKSKHISDNVISAHPLEQIESAPDDMVTIMFETLTLENTCTNGISMAYDCVYWDTTENNWSNLGCNHAEKKISDKYYHICTCNHTTSFALLLTIDSFPYCYWCEEVLKYISLVGILLSLIGLIITLFYDICINLLPESDPMTFKSSSSIIVAKFSDMSKQYLRTITTWCFMLFLMNIFYIAFSFYTISEKSIDDMDDSRKNSCITIGVFLHYTLLSSFCFTLAITVTQYFIFYKSFNIYSYIYIKSILFSFGTPTVIVSIVLIINKYAYINPNKYCWLKSEFTIYSAVLPIALILFTNFVFYLLIIVKYAKNDNTKKKYVNSIETDKRDSKRQLILHITCFVNTGLTWIFGFLVTIPGNESWIYLKFVYALLFSLLNSTQGFHIFVVYILISKKRHAILKKKLFLTVDHLKQLRKRISSFAI